MDELHRLTIDSLAHGGDGVGRDDTGRVVFVPFSSPGDRLLVTIVHEGARFARGRIAEIEQASPARVDPRCPYAGTCGGCHWQHISYDAQLAAKHQTVADTLGRIGGLGGAVSVSGIIPASTPYGYRNRVELSASSEGPLMLGYARADGGGLASVDSCELLPKKHRRLPKALSGALRYAQGADDLGITRCAIRSSRRTGSLAVEVWTRPGPAPRPFLAKTVSDATSADTVSRVLVRPEKGRRAIRGVEILTGSGLWRDTVAGHRFSVSPTSFFQANSEQADALVSLVLDALAPEPRDVVLDAYAGVGTFTLPLAATGCEVVAIEGAGSALSDLRENLDATGLDADVVPGDVARALPETGPVDLAVVDPPRSGMPNEAVDALCAAEPRRIAYVSCDPATFARDIRRLYERGYALGAVTPVDLFPQTYHIEVVGILDRT